MSGLEKHTGTEGEEVEMEDVEEEEDKEGGGAGCLLGQSSFLSEPRLLAHSGASKSWVTDNRLQRQRQQQQQRLRHHGCMSSGRCKKDA